MTIRSYISTAKSLSRERSNLQSPTFGRSWPSGRECSKSRATRVLAAGESATETDHIATRHATLSSFRDFFTRSNEVLTLESKWQRFHLLRWPSLPIIAQKLSMCGLHFKNVTHNNAAIVP